MRRFPVVALLALLVLVSACGGDDSDSADPTTPPRTARATAEADKSRAERIVLTAADLPGYTEDASAEEDEEVDEPFAACVENDPVLTAEEGTDPRTVDGSDFEKSDGEMSVGSTATIAETEDQARTAMTRLRGQGVLDCIGTSFREGLVETLGPEARLRSVDVEELPVTAVGDESVGLRLVATVTAQGQTLPVTSDITAIRRERAVAFLLTTGVHGPFPQAERSALATRLADRMGP